MGQSLVYRSKLELRHVEQLVQLTASWRSCVEEVHEVRELAVAVVRSLRTQAGG